MDAPKFQSEAGFGLIELLISMVILQVALFALISVFSSSAVALGRAGSWTTASVLADARMELFRSMPYDAIGLDTAAAPTTGAYVADTGVCPSGQTPVCANTGPVSNSATVQSIWSCTAATDSLPAVMSVSLHFSANGASPCLAHRSVVGATSPDGKPYDIDTYVSWGVARAGQRPTKQVFVVVRKSGSTIQLAKLATSFDCSTGQPLSNTNGC
jgi:Tfp pilus assembly protein PilV